MDHFFQSERFEDSYCTYPNLYQQFARQIQDGGTIVELGSWKGQSASVMCVELFNQQKNKVRFFTVDTWEGSEGEGHKEDKWIKEGKLYDKFKENLQDVENYYIPLKMTTEQASHHFSDGSCDIVFIDADHTYEGVKKDIKLWKNKIRKGGTLAGHDYDPAGKSWAEVKKAVDESFGNDVMPVIGGCWMVQR